MRFENETKFNEAVRNLLTARGLQCVHVREAHKPGPLDLVVWWGRILVAWIELKVDDEEVRPSQKEFIRDNPKSSLVLRWSNEREVLYVSEGHPEGKAHYGLTWDQFVNFWSVNIAEWAMLRQEQIEE